MKTGKKIVLEIPRQLVDKRLDVATLALIRKKYTENKLSRGDIISLIKAGEITLNNTKTKASHLVSLHDKIEILENDLVISEPKLETRDITIPILYEDDFLIAVNKLAGIQTHPAGNPARDTVAHFISSKYPKIRKVGENPLRPGIVHRLDRETSGVLVVAKTKETFEELKKLFQNRKIEKTYTALVYGHLPKLEGVVDKPLARQKGKLKRAVAKNNQASGTTHPALTIYHVITRYRNFDLLEVTPKTGRTHQIRVHFAHLGHPIVGDKFYSFKNIRREKKLFPARQMLHAYRLRFELFEKKYAFQAPLPEDFRSLLSGIDETKKASYDDEALRSLLEQ
jgi:23S rRNA pseudouridine1911/1915/1917 synthase